METESVSEVSGPHGMEATEEKKFTLRQRQGTGILKTHPKVSVNGANRTEWQRFYHVKMC